MLISRIIRLRYNKSNDRWDIMDIKGDIMFDNKQTDIPDCYNFKRYFKGLNKDKINVYSVTIEKIRDDIT